MRYGGLTYIEIKEKTKNGAIAILPTGCTEQQGYHLPVNFDTWLVEELTEAASLRAKELFNVETLVLPAMPFGPTTEHKNYGHGYVDIPLELHQRLIWYAAKSLQEQGFENIVIWLGCGGHKIG